jgi:hypothetical protein
LEWKRISDLYTDFVVLPDVLQESDILQGSIGDCYFVTCLAALASKPERIRKLFKTQTPQPDGKYVVTLCINGSWEEVVVDDYLPVLQGANKPRFATAKTRDGRGVAWVSLIEKAWAKLCGNYDRVATGTVDMGFIHLCGVPSIGLKHFHFG